MPIPSSIRINKYISDSGMCSRRDADRYVENGRVLINDLQAEFGAQVFDGDVVKVDGQLIGQRDETGLVLLVLNKPVGIITSMDESLPDNIGTLIHHSKRIFPVGRLDKDSQGLILLTNHGDMVNKILRAGNDHEKEYVVTVNKPVTDAFILGLSTGVPMLGTVTKACKVVKESEYIFRITLVQGLNRQIRRMSKYFGFEVTRLERVRIMNIHLEGLPLGESRELTGDEEKELLRRIQHSVSDETLP
ncbi:23S rRNA pseudouridine(2604) synthase RluF [Rahnella inusitata]|uniref:23S rRNA pseudouridine(2604) synthase RluF n=1 Tax=Rahnella inusitata TaxID=58169 RepID=UPI001BC84D6C|nr:23S rRNA pseudouridine(2604) synthase RluF [Rahnella inusitata]QUT15615.1 23S rRNA pseudouridine(2604) synthase RluF [Rahnella inusitata]